MRPLARTSVTSGFMIVLPLLVVIACEGSGSDGNSPPSPAPQPAGSSRSEPRLPAPVATGTVVPSPVPSAPPEAPKSCRASCEEVIAAFLARNGGRHPFRLSLLPDAPSVGAFVAVAVEGNPRRGTFRFESSSPLGLPFTAGEYVLEGEYLALFPTPEAADSRTGPMLFAHRVLREGGREILSRVHVIDPDETHRGVWIFP